MYLLFANQYTSTQHVNYSIPKLYIEVYIESRTDIIRPFTKRIEINGYGFDPICIHNKIECFDINNNKLDCYCHSVEKGSMSIGFSNALTKENKGNISVSITVRDLKRIPSVVVGVLDFNDYGMFYFFFPLPLLSIFFLSVSSCFSVETKSKINK